MTPKRNSDESLSGFVYILCNMDFKPALGISEWEIAAKVACLRACAYTLQNVNQCVADENNAQGLPLPYEW